MTWAVNLIAEFLFNEALKWDRHTVEDMRLDELVDYANFAGSYFEDKRKQRGAR